MVSNETAQRNGAERRKDIPGFPLPNFGCISKTEQQRFVLFQRYHLILQQTFLLLQWMKRFSHHLSHTASFTGNEINLKLFYPYKIRQGVARKANQQPARFLLILDDTETENCAVPFPGEHVVSVARAAATGRTQTQNSSANSPAWDCFHCF